MIFFDVCWSLWLLVENELDWDLDMIVVEIEFRIKLFFDELIYDVLVMFINVYI